MKNEKKKTGPKPLYGETMVPQRVMLPPALVRKARLIGDGTNLSKGVRVALEAYETTEAP